mmetsp:Transcript_66463/g.203396  ORF Transcript_66463/g.203396 Transcript_66463/m.203396 type:complete len:209 (+) Transcript_66463:306-932(+)
MMVMKPMALMMLPSTAMVPKRSMLRAMSQNAFLAEVQNHVPKSAVWMYAFLFRYLMHFSKHQMQHCKHLKTNAITLFFCAAACFSKNFITYRMNCTTATMNEPRATVPMWYRNTTPTPCFTTNVVALFAEKNHRPTAMAMSICPRATLKALFQRKTKKETAKRQSKTYRGGAQRQHFGSLGSLTSQSLSFHTEPVGHLSVHFPGVPLQ